MNASRKFAVSRTKMLLWFALSIAVLGLVAGARLSRTQGQSVPTSGTSEPTSAASGGNTRGWAWNAYQLKNSTAKIGLGWVSMNCLNDFDNDGKLDYQCDRRGEEPPRGSTYGLTVNDGGDGLGNDNDYVQGCTWSAPYGWICYSGGEGQEYQCDSGENSICRELSTDGVKLVVGEGFRCSIDRSSCSTLTPCLNYTDPLNRKRCTNKPEQFCQSASQCPAGGACSASLPQTCQPYFYTLDSPVYTANSGWGSLSDHQYAGILSVTEPDEDKGFIGFPYSKQAAFSRVPSSSALHGCFGCVRRCSTDWLLECAADLDCPSSGTCNQQCDACLNTSARAEDPTNNPSPNLLCWNCGNKAGRCNGNAAVPCKVDNDCVIANAGMVCGNLPPAGGVETPCTVADSGSCSMNRDKNSCHPASCAGCTTMTGVVVNKRPSGDYEMCGWGWNGWDPQQSVTPTTNIISENSIVGNGRYGDIAVDSVGLPAISYIEQKAGVGDQVVLTRCGDPFCTIRRKIVIESDGGVNDVIPTRTAILINQSDIPIVAYIGGPAGNNLRVFACADKGCSSGSSETAITFAAQPKEADIIQMPDGTIFASAMSSLNDRVKNIQCSNNLCSSFETQLSQSDLAVSDIVSYRLVGIYYSLTNYRPGYAYILSGGTFYAWMCNDYGCTSGGWGGSGTQQGIWNFRAFDTYFDQTTKEFVNVLYNELNDEIRLWTMTANPPSFLSTVGGKVLATNVNGSSVQGSLSVTINKQTGAPVISYITNNRELRVITCSDKQCTTSTNVKVLDGGSDNVPRYHTALAMSVVDHPVVVYYHEKSSALADYSIRLMGCHTPTCASQNKGLGWLAFSPNPASGFSFIESGGNILSTKSIYSPKGPPVGKYNSAYILEAGGDITNWYSKNAYKYERGQALPTFLRPVPFGDNQIYRNALGKLDYRGLVTNVVTGIAPDGSCTASGSCANKFGSKLVFRNPNDGIPSTSLNDQVFYWEGNTTIASGTIACPTTINTTGTGVFVVNGNLTISSNITYATPCTLSKLRQLPTAVWIVRGDVSIAPTVSEVAGSFVVLGSSTSQTRFACPDLNESSNGCGRFSTGTGSAQLTINGTVIARQLKLERASASATEPSEKFIADGRLQANPPRGLTDLSKSVPRFTSGF